MFPFPYHRFTSPEHQAWKQDRFNRQHLRTPDHTRRRLGLAVLWQNVDADFECVGDRIFYTNSNLRWLALRDIPAGHFPCCSNLNRRVVNWASLTTARLAYGMPRLDFAAGAEHRWDFAMMPYGQAEVRSRRLGHHHWTARGDTLNSEQHPRLFAVLNRLSAAMTERALRYPRHRQSDPHRNGQTVATMPQMQDCFPQPYLGLRPVDLGRLQDQPDLQVHWVTLKMHPGLIFCPVQWTARRFTAVPSVELVWECDCLGQCIEAELEAAILPPLLLRRWDQLRFGVRGVDLEVTVGDPRYRKLDGAFQTRPATEAFTRQSA